MNLKKIFSALKKSSNAYAVPNEFRLTDILGEDDLLANRKLTAASYSLTWQNPPQSALVFMAFPYGLNGGGLRTIITQMESMSARWGLKNYICFYPRYKQSPKNLKLQETLKENMRREFPLLNFEIIPYSDNFDDYPEVDIALCNWWLTAFPLAKFRKCRQKYYLLQDFEPCFSQAGSTYAVTEESYRFGFIGLANSSALAGLYRSYGNRAVYCYQAGVNHRLYYPRPDKHIGKTFTKLFFTGGRQRPATILNFWRKYLRR